MNQENPKIRDQVFNGELIVVDEEQTSACHSRGHRSAKNAQALVSFAFNQPIV